MKDSAAHQQPVYLMMAGQAEKNSDNIEKTMREY
jgi:hypothetical protein